MGPTSWPTGSPGGGAGTLDSHTSSCFRLSFLLLIPRCRSHFSKNAQPAFLSCWILGILWRQARKRVQPAFCQHTNPAEAKALFRQPGIQEAPLWAWGPMWDVDAHTLWALQTESPQLPTVFALPQQASRQCQPLLRWRKHPQRWQKQLHLTP